MTAPVSLPPLPDRPLKVRIPGSNITHRLLAGFGLLALLGLTIASFIFVAPTLWTDWQVRNTAQPVVASRIENGSCRSKLFINTCNVTLGAGKASDAVRRSVTYVFADAHSGDYSVQVLADPEHPEWLTTDLALDKLPSRLITIGAFWALILVGVIAMIRGLMVRRAVRREVLSWDGQRLKAAPLELVSVRGSAGISNWTVKVPGERGKGRVWSLPSKARPFFIGEDTILGVTGPQSGVVAPLDYGLTWIDLTEEERAAIGRAIHPAVAEGGEAVGSPATA